MAPKYNNWKWPLWTVTIKLNKTWKKSIHIKTIGTLQNWNKEVKSSYVQIFVDLDGHDMLTPPSRAIT